MEENKKNKSIDDEELIDNALEKFNLKRIKKSKAETKVELINTKFENRIVYEDVDLLYNNSDKKKIRTNLILNQNFELKFGQTAALNYLLEGKNTFLKGDAGTGKTFLIEAFSNEVSLNGFKVLKVAPTSEAVKKFEIHNKNEFTGTIHSVFKLKKGVYSKETKIPNNLVKDVISKFDIIIIDEISMVRVDIFHYISKIIKIANEYRFKNNKPMIQLIVTGDFYQMPPRLPISKSDRELIINQFKKQGHKDFEWYVFEDEEVWNYWNFQIVSLWDTIRNHDDKDFYVALRMLKNLNNRVRIVDFLNHLNEHYSNPYDIKDFNPIALFVFQTNADEYNNVRLQEDTKTIGDDIISNAIVTPKSELDFLLNHCNKDVKNAFSSKFPSPISIKYKINAPIIFTQNDNESINNTRFNVGDRGHIVDGDKDGKWVIVELSTDDFRNGNKIAIVKTTSDIELVKNKTDKSFIYSKCIYKIPKRPIIKSASRDSSLVQEFYDGEYIQFPFMLGYATTISQAQGQTYNYLIVDPKNISYNGQLYVALSRAKKMEQLRLNNEIKCEYDEETKTWIGHAKSSLIVEAFEAKCLKKELIPPLDDENQLFKSFNKVLLKLQGKIAKSTFLEEKSDERIDLIFLKQKRIDELREEMKHISNKMSENSKKIGELLTDSRYNQGTIADLRRENGLLGSKNVEIQNDLIKLSNEIYDLMTKKTKY